MDPLPYIKCQVSAKKSCYVLLCLVHPMEDNPVAEEYHIVTTQLLEGIKVSVSQAENVHNFDTKEKDQVRDNGKLEVIIIVQVEGLQKLIPLVGSLILCFVQRYTFTTLHSETPEQN